MVNYKEIPRNCEEFSEFIDHVQDEHGCYRPVSIFPNPKYGNDGLGHEKFLTEQNRSRFSFPAYYSVAIYFRESPSSELRKVLEERSRVFAAKENFKIEGFRVLEKRTTYKEI